MSFNHSKFALLLSCIPILMISVYVFCLGVNIPFMDQWDLVPLLQKRQQGLLTFADLVAQHNEHRPLFPRLIWLGLAALTRYNVNAELWVNLLIATGTFVFFVQMATRTWDRLGASLSPLSIPLISLLVFNLGQRESWLQGFQTVMFLGMACVVIGLFTLAGIPSWRNLLIAASLGCVATYSMVNGILYWIVGLLVIWVTSPATSRISRAVSWMFFSAVGVGSFLAGWTSAGHLNPAVIFVHPLESCIWLLNFIGAPLMTSRYVAWTFGLVSVGLYILIIKDAIRNGYWRMLAPYMAIVLFIFSTGVSISLGRADFGMAQSTVSRYLTLSVWYWASLLALLPLLHLRNSYQRVLYSAMTMSLVALTILGGWRGYVTLHHRMLPAYHAVISGQVVSDDVLRRIYPDPDIARLRLEYLCKNSWSACAEIR